MRSLVFLLLFAPLAAADVRVVSSTGPYTQIQAAVNAANEGDLVLVRTGKYASFTIQAKSLTVAVDTGAIVNLPGGITVSGVGTGQTVNLIGLRPYGEPGFTSMPWAFRSLGNQGRVRCERCNFSAQQFDTDAVQIQSSFDVSFVACQMAGGGGDQVGGAGARVIASTVSFFDCSLSGGNGFGYGGLADAGDGGPGMSASGGTIFSSGSSFVGGSGGIVGVAGIIIVYPGDGAAGAELFGGSSMQHIETIFVGGHHGGYGGWAGSAPDTSGGTFNLIPGTKRTMTGANPVRELTSLGFSLHSAPGESVYLLLSLETGLQWDPAHEANFLLASPFRTLPVGTTNGSGNLSINLPLSDLGVGVQSEMLYLQPLFVGPSGEQQLGTPITLAALDGAF